MAGVPFTTMDAYDLFEQAKDQPNGIEIECGDPSAATTLRHRLNRYRAKDREDNKLTYPSGHQLHGRSTYDDLSLTVPKENPTVVLIKPRPAFIIRALGPEDIKPAPPRLPKGECWPDSNICDDCGKHFNRQLHKRGEKYLCPECYQRSYQRTRLTPDGQTGTS